MIACIAWYFSVSLQTLSEITPPIWFDMNVDNYPAYQVVLVYPLAKFEKTYLH